MVEHKFVELVTVVQFHQAVPISRQDLGGCVAALKGIAYQWRLGCRVVFTIGGEVGFKSGRRDVGVPGGWSGQWGCCLSGEWIGVY